MTLYERLSQLNKSDMLPLHMPGHKRSNVIPAMSGIYGIDITEIDGFDDLHDPGGIIAGMQKRASDLYGAGEARISVNGSTAAIEAAILSVCRAGDTIIIPRVSHKSVYYAIEMGHLKPVYLEQGYMPGTSVVLPPDADTVEKACAEHSEAVCVLITSPTYEGLMADISGIARVVHSHGMVLITDSAHGAHLGFGIGSNTLREGADLSVVSLHKMLPAPTQTALLLTAGAATASAPIPVDRISHYMQVLQSSSPSYVLMAGIDECLGYMEERLRGDIERAKALSEKFRTELADMEHLGLLSAEHSDPLKAVIRSKMTSFSGRDLYMGLLRDYHIQCEMYGTDYCLAMFSPVDESSSFDRLKEALLKIDSGIEDDTPDEREGRPCADREKRQRIYVPRAAMSAAEAYGHRSAVRHWGPDIIGGISSSYICLYPPGVPLIVPGEIIDDEVYGLIDRGLQTGLGITGLRDGQVMVVERDE